MEYRTAYRLQYTAIAFVGLLAPLLVAYATLIVSPRSQTSASGSPNPSRSSRAFLGPADVLVHYDPWFAGVIRFWLAAWVAIGGLFVASVFFAWPMLGLHGYKSAAVLAALSLLLGAIISSPWWYALVVTP